MNNQIKFTMFFALSKIIDFILLPICWLFILLILGLFQKNNFRKNIIFSLSILLLFLFTNPTFVNQLFKWYEYPQTQLNAHQKYTWGIVLGGGMVHAGDTTGGRIHVGDTGDRFAQPILLYQKGIIKKILITGGNTSIGQLKIDHGHESADVKKLMISYGVRENDIFLEIQAKNTRENAIYSSDKLLNFKQDTVLLITSAAHMRRSIGCYKKVGFKIKPYPVDFEQRYGQPGFLDSWMPHEGNMYKLAQIIREMFGFVVYKIMGYC